jgi:hypothetical protein
VRLRTCFVVDVEELRESTIFAHSYGKFQTQIESERGKSKSEIDAFLTCFFFSPLYLIHGSSVIDLFFGRPACLPVLCALPPPKIPPHAPTHAPTTLIKSKHSTQKHSVCIQSASIKADLKRRGLQSIDRR